MMKTAALLLCALLASVAVSGQTAGNGATFDVFSGVFTPKWAPDQTAFQKQHPELTLVAPHFDGASLDGAAENLPVRAALVPVERNQRLTLSNVGGAETEVSSPIFRHLTKPNRVAIFGEAEYYPAQPVVLGDVVTQNKKNYQIVYFYPIQISRSGTSYKKYSNITYSLGKTAAPQARTAGNRTYAANSVLASGSWYKIGVTQTGIHKIDYAFLNELGVNPGSLNPKTIRIFGNGGGMLIQANSAPRRDDLSENMILVQGEQDGVFNQDDYILFYAEGPDRISTLTVSAEEEWLRHQKNLYSDTTYYFINVNQAEGKRIGTKASVGGGVQVSESRNIAYFNKDQNNLIKMGRLWFGDLFDFNTSYNYTLAAPNMAPGTDIRVTIRVAARSINSPSFDLSESGKALGNIPVNGLFTEFGSSSGRYALVTEKTFTLNSNFVTDGSLDFKLNFNKNGSSLGWLDYIEVEYTQKLQMTGSQHVFYLKPSAGAVQSVAYGNMPSGVSLWDVTAPDSAMRQDGSFSGNTFLFGAEVPRLRKFIAFNGGSFYTPSPVGRVNNQNLHGLAQADYLIVSHPNFITYANELADLHRSVYGRVVHVANVYDIYNEFSSGAQDVTAIRDFAKMFYDRSGAPSLKYLLLFGDGSYDYKRLQTQVFGNYVPCYEARQSLSPPDAFTSDDFFAMLDDNEGNWGEGGQRLFDEDKATEKNLMDIGVGRFPAHDEATAATFVRKTRDYVNNPQSFGDWRNKLLLIADYKGGEPYHMSDADKSYSQKIQPTTPCFNVDKIYLDAYPVVNLAEGARYPAAVQAIKDKLTVGQLIVNYTGHGGETGLSNSRIFEIADINKLSNGLKLPLWITATCEFGRYDDPDRTTGAEYLFMNANGGSIGLITSCRQVYTSGNKEFNLNIYDYALVPNAELGRHLTFGEINARAKNETFSFDDINTRNFTLLGDPGIGFALPKYECVVTEINGQPANTAVLDTIKALSMVKVKGEVRNGSELLSNFKGEAAVTVYDKPQKMTTLTTNVNYQLQRNAIFNGVASVNSGKFEFQFVVPVDISYEAGLGKISVYANDQQTDAGGCNENFVVCCTDPNATSSLIPPDVQLFMNGLNWIDGGMVNPEPKLIAKVSDDLGINTSGLGIGRELTGIVDGDEANPVILNPYYTAKKDSYKEGTIEYKISSLSDGEHRLRVKVWDVTNLSATAETKFFVTSDSKLVLDKILNYPNPFTTNTTFFFNHNRAGQDLDVQINIYTISGRLVKSLKSKFYAESNVCNHIDWDGLDEFGERIGRGVYVYEVKVRAPGVGESVSEFEKLVLLR